MHLQVIIYLFMYLWPFSERREPTITTVREELPLVDQPKVTLHDDIPYIEPPYTIQLLSSNCLVVPSPLSGGVLNGGGPCNHMGGGEIVVSSGEESTIMEMMGTLGKPDSGSALDMGLGQGTETAN